MAASSAEVIQQAEEVLKREVGENAIFPMEVPAVAGK
jgi:hypothetical protein